MSEIPRNRPWRSEALDIFIISLAMMMFEVNLVRLFSVVMRHHLAFFVLAIALFGIGLGGLCAQLWMRRMTSDGPSHKLYYLSIALALSMMITLIVLAALPLNVRVANIQIPKIQWLFVVFLISATPFFLGSMFISQLFAYRPGDTNRLYFSDLTGAALGCLLSLWALGHLGGLSAPFAIGAVAAIPACRAFWKVNRLAASWAVLVFLFGITLAGANIRYNFVDALAKSSSLGVDLIFSKWNFHARIGVRPINDWPGWRISPKYQGPIPAHIQISQDNRAPAYGVNFDGDFEKVQYLRYDITSMPFRMTSPQKALIIGAGGGRDLLTAKLYDVPKVTGIELNPIIANDVARGAFRDYLGGVYELPGVDVLIDSGRTFCSRTHETFDLVFLSFADSQSASQQGASVMTENHLYTVEAFRSYWRVLTENGVCASTGATAWSERWFVRSVNTIRAALEAEGVTEPSRHIMAILTPKGGGNATCGMYIAISRQPVNDDMVNRALASCDELGFDLVWPPARPVPLTNEIAALFDPMTRDQLVSHSPFDLTPVVDNRPYIWYAVTPATAFRLLFMPSTVKTEFPEEIIALHRLMNFFIVAFVCVFALMFLPLLTLRGGENLHVGGRLAYLAVFFLLGAAYMLVEISLLQDFFLVLGQPTLAFAVLLAAMLLFTGIGSYVSRRFTENALKKCIFWASILTVVILTISLAILPRLTHALLAVPFSWACAATVVLLAIVATPMGLLFPSALRLVDRRGFNMICWAWGMNGMGSVLGSVGSTFISMNYGINAILLAGVLGYVLVAITSLFLSSAKTS